MPLTEQEEFELLSLEREKFMASQEQPQQQPQAQPMEQQFNQQQNQQFGGIDKKQLLGGLLLGGAGAVGYGAYKGGLVPAIQERFQNITQKQQAIDTLKGLQKQLGIEGTEAEYIPKKISELETRYKTEIKLKENQIKYQSDLALKNAKSALDDFDNKILSSKVEDLSKALEENYPKFLRRASQGYEAGKVAIETYLQDKGIRFDSLKFERNFIDKTISEGMSRGLTETELSPLMRLKSEVAPKYNAQGILAQEKPIAFSQMKGYVSGMTRQEPQGRLAALVNKNWIDFLDNSLPPDVSPAIKGQLSKINTGYKQFAEARFQYSKILSQAGEFNRKAANKYLLDYFKTNIDDGTKQLIGFISKGNDIVQGIEGIEGKFKALTELKSQRVNLSIQQQITQQLKKEALNQLSEDATKTITKLRGMRSKYDEFISRLRIQQEKSLGNKLSAIPRAIKFLSKIGKIGGTALSVYPLISGAIEYSQDPEAWIISQETGVSIEELKQTKERLKSGKMTDEEKLNAGLAI